MSGNRQLSAGVVLAILSIVMTLGGFLAASAEQGRVTLVVSPTAPASPTGLVLPPPTSIDGGVATPLPPASPTAPNAASPSSTSASCTPPAGWVSVTVASGETLAVLAGRYNTSEAELMTGNCLLVAVVATGSQLYVPGLPPTASQTTPPQAQCGPPAGWTRHTIRAGNTLYSLAQAYRVTVAQLQFANCMGASTYIRTGDSLWVPNVATTTPTRTLTPTASRTPTLTNTVPASPTATASQTAVNTPTATETATPSETPSPSATATETPTETPTATETP